MEQKNSIEQVASQKSGIEQGTHKRKRNKRGNFVAKILCFIVAFIIWLYVMNVESPEHEKTFSSVPVTIENAAVLASNQNLSVISGAGNVIDVTVKGKKSEIAKYSASDIKASVDVSRITEAGRHTLDVSVSLPTGLVVSSVTPNNINVSVDTLSTKTISVKVNIRSVQIEADYELGVPLPDFTVVTVKGPATVIDAISHAQVDLDLGRVTQSLSSRAALRLIDMNDAEVINPNVTLSQSSVTVNVPVYTTKELLLKVDYLHGFYNRDNVDIEISPKTIKVKGEPSVLENMTELLIKTIDEKQVVADGSQIVQIALPQGLINAGTTETATINITHKNTGTKTITVDNIRINNPKGLNYELLTKTINVTLRGPLVNLPALQPVHVTASTTLDYEASSGLISVPLTITVASQHTDTVYEIGTYYIQVRVN